MDRSLKDLASLRTAMRAAARPSVATNSHSQQEPLSRETATRCLYESRGTPAESRTWRARSSMTCDGSFQPRLPMRAIRVAGAVGGEAGEDDDAPGAF
eukprot:15470322-Alexandrium_andersonii.AAC.1